MLSNRLLARPGPPLLLAPAATSSVCPAGDVQMASVDATGGLGERPVHTGEGGGVQNSREACGPVCSVCGRSAGNDAAAGRRRGARRGGAVYRGSWLDAEGLLALLLERDAQVERLKGALQEVEHRNRVMR